MESDMVTLKDHDVQTHKQSRPRWMHVITDAIACAHAREPEVDGGNSYLSVQLSEYSQASV